MKQGHNEIKQKNCKETQQESKRKKKKKKKWKDEQTVECYQKSNLPNLN